MNLNLYWVRLRHLFVCERKICMIKKIVSLFLVFILVFSFASCGEEQSVEDESLIVDLLNSDSDKPTDSDEIKMSGAYPEYICGWHDGEDNNTYKYYYTGGEFVVNYYLANGAFQTNYALCVMLDGVLQSFYIVDNITGEKSELTTTLPVTMSADTEKDFSIHFVPNTGNKGDVLELSVGVFYDYNYTIQAGATFMSYGQSHDFRDAGCRKVVMQTDSDNTADIASYDAAYLSVDSRISSVFPYLFDSDGLSTQYIYTDTIDSMFNDDGMINYVCASADSVNTFNFDFIAKTGTYRISVFVDHVQQEIADDCYYIDVETMSDKATHIEIELDNTDMSGWHHIYFMARKIDDNFDCNKITSKSKSYILILE